MNPKLPVEGVIDTPVNKYVKHNKLRIYFKSLLLIVLGIVVTLLFQTILEYKYSKKGSEEVIQENIVPTVSEEIVSSHPQGIDIISLQSEIDSEYITGARNIPVQGIGDDKYIFINGRKEQVLDTDNEGKVLTFRADEDIVMPQTAEEGGSLVLYIKNELGQYIKEFEKEINVKVARFLNNENLALLIQRDHNVGSGGQGEPTYNFHIFDTSTKTIKEIGNLKQGSYMEYYNIVTISPDDRYSIISIGYEFYFDKILVNLLNGKITTLNEGEYNIYDFIWQGGNILKYTKSLFITPSDYSVDKEEIWSVTYDLNSKKEINLIKQ